MDFVGDGLDVTQLGFAHWAPGDMAWTFVDHFGWVASFTNLRTYDSLSLLIGSMGVGIPLEPIVNVLTDDVDHGFSPP